MCKREWEKNILPGKIQKLIKIFYISSFDKTFIFNWEIQDFFSSFSFLKQWLLNTALKDWIKNLRALKKGQNWGQCYKEIYS